MPSLDIATVQPSLQAHLVPLGPQCVIHAKTLPIPWKKSPFFKHLELYMGHPRVRRGKLIIAAVATLETKSPVRKKTEQSGSLLSGSSSLSSTQNGSTVEEDVEQVDERERMRRMRISKANRGNTPWNKGRRHSPETLQKIRERTKIAMQNPKIKLKLANLGHAQSEETRLKIGEGVRLRWERRKERKMVQERCHHEWQNLIAEAARRGSTNEAELHWDSYKILDEQLQQEWLETLEQRKAMQAGKGNRKAPKSFEQRRKIAEAIAAKWADPDYRERVCSGLLKYHGTTDGTEKRRRKPSSNAEPRKRSPPKKSTRNTASSKGSEQRSQIQLVKLRRRKKSVYKDPLASSKLEMIKSIRAKRAAEESKKSEALERARLLIAEAEKAAKALELAATKSPIAQASLLESRKLIAEATQLIKSIESREIASVEDGTFSSVLPNQPTSLVESNMESENMNPNEQKQGGINGAHMPPFSTNKDNSGIIVNGDRENVPLCTSSDLRLFSLEGAIKQSVSAKQTDNVGTDRITKLGTDLQPNGSRVQPSEPNRTTIEFPESPVPNGTKVHTAEEKVTPLRPGAVTKKWVRGRLIEVVEAA